MPSCAKFRAKIENVPLCLKPNFKRESTRNYLQQKPKNESAYLLTML